MKREIAFLQWLIFLSFICWIGVKYDRKSKSRWQTYNILGEIRKDLIKKKQIYHTNRIPNDATLLDDYTRKLLAKNANYVSFIGQRGIKYNIIALERFEVFKKYNSVSYETNSVAVLRIGGSIEYVLTNNIPVELLF